MPIEPLRTFQIPAVECADRLTALYWHRSASRAGAAILIVVGCVVTGVQAGDLWIGACGVLLAAVVVVFPQLRRLHRFLMAVECPRCHKPVGSYVTQPSRVFLRCQHCGEESATDCIISYAGGPPSKV